MSKTPDHYYVKVIFSPFTGSQTYTYKVPDSVPMVLPGDYVVVDTPSNGYQITKVRAIDIPKPDFPCKRIVCRVDDSDYKDSQ